MTFATRLNELHSELAAPFVVTGATRDGRTVIAVEGDLDRSNVAQVRREVERRRSRPTPFLVLDLSATTFMDASGLHLIDELAATAEADAATLALVVATRPVRRVLALAPPPAHVDIVCR